MLNPNVSFGDIEGAIQSEYNHRSGNLQIDGIDNFIIIEGKFQDYRDLSTYSKT